MTINERIYTSLFIGSVLILLLVNEGCSFECKHEEFDLSRVSGTWLSRSDDSSTVNLTYKISLCSPLKPNGANDHACPTTSSVCLMYDNGTALSAGNFNASADQLTGGNNAEEGEMWIILPGDPCPEDKHYNLTTSINFKCGPTLGSPVFLSFSGCVSYFEWETDVYCKNPSVVNEVKCYLYDDKWNRYDLSPLAKTKGAYLVSSEGITDMYINVCRDITPDSQTTGCPAGSGACRKSGRTSESFGIPKDSLKRSADGRLTLKYETSSSDTKPPGCTSPPSTTIVFICPKRGENKDPLIIESFDCQYVIEWQTEYACPETRLSNNSCVLTKADADIDIDLRPLKRTKGNPYHVSYTDTSSSKGDVYDFYLNICEELELPCPDDDHLGRIPVCKTLKGHPTFGKALGSTDHMKLTYADDKLTLSYKGGELCNQTRVKRQTIINFICKQDAGIGQPKYIRESDCSFFFDWETRYACLDHPKDESCRVNVDGQRYDMSSLVRNTGVNWVALHEDNEKYGTGQYYINVCHNILQSEGASRCDPSAAICYRETLSTLNLGRYESAPIFINGTNSTQIKYTNGDICKGTTRITSTITFYCKPGESESAPVLVDKSDDRCFYQFEWYTSAACILGHYKGSNCRIHADGINFDLTPLRKADGESYKVDSAEDAEFEYFINVCGPVTNSACNSTDIKQVGICQQPIPGHNGDSYVAGQWTSDLTYYDGMINLTYVHGTPYHDDAQTPRQSEIAFLCDLDAGKGTPKYLTEVKSNHYYAFEWRTSYACPHAAIQCSAVDSKTGQEYDLSSLTRSPSQDNWSITGSDNTKYYINICQPLNEVPGRLCDPFAAVCRTKITDNKEEADIKDMGHVDSMLTVRSESRLQLIYKEEGGGSCNNGTATVPYITNIQFLCRLDALSSTPSAPLKDGPCEYTILWDTVAACPIKKDKDTEKCTAKDPDTNYVYNLNPLTHEPSEPYSVQVGDTTYKINICGTVSDCSNVNGEQLPSVCQFTKQNSTITGLTGEGSNLDFSQDGGMSLETYGNRLGNGQLVTVKIIFLCAQDKEFGAPVFVAHEGNVYIFNFLTSLACKPLATDCVIQDEAGNQYDLTSLEKDTYWTARDTRDDSTYYINVCRPVNNAPDSKCPDAPIGGCQVASNGGVHSMGYIQSKPIAHSDGSVTVRYRNGDVCHKGSANEAHRSTRINFFCAVTEEGPVFETETETCEYVFNWKTPAACAIQRQTGDHCKVVEPRFKHEFDLSLLRKSDLEYKVYSGDYTYLINVCGKLHEHGHCDLNTGVGACQTKNDTNFPPVNAGIANSNLLYDGGELTLTYTGGKDKCHGQYERQTIVRFVCDFSANGDKGPRFIEESYNCHYVFEWATNLACPPHIASSCAVSDDLNNIYDLSVLGLLNDNYEVVDSIEKKRYIINVCRSLVHKKNATCPYNAAACMVDLDKPESDPDTYKSIGEPVGQPLKYENGKIVLVYTNGDLCKNGKDRMTTHITFTCDKNARHSVPVGHFMVGECDHHFLWQSSVACPEDTTDHTSDSEIQPADITCLVTDPATGTVFDLTPLRITGNSPWSVTDKQGHKYEFNVCGAVTKSACTDSGDSIGVCQSSTDSSGNTVNAGNAVHDIWFDDGVVIQNFTGGDRCHSGKYERNTIITFVCNQNRGIGRPMFIDETEDCTYYISWHTSIVCENEIKCSVENSRFQTIDLSPLSRNPDHVVYSTDDNTEFYLSICSSLTPSPGRLCPYGAGVCRVKESDGVEHSSLGSPKSSPIYNADTDEVQLVYLNGSKCDTDPSKNFTSRIIFTCLPGPVRSRPVFAGKTDCEYVFNWATAVVCTEEPSNVCGYHDTNNQEYYDLSKLQMPTPYEVDVDGEQFLVNMCSGIASDDTSSCDNHMVCRKKDGMSFGEPKDFKVVQEEGVLKMFYAVGGNCSDGSVAHSSFQFRCDRNAGVGQPTKWASVGCDVVFDWPTNVVCASIERPCSITVDNHLYDLSILSKKHGAWTVTDVDKNTYWLNVCTDVEGADIPDICTGSRNAGACLKQSGGGSYLLGSVSAQNKLYKNATTGALVLEYKNGGPACSGRRGDNSAATTKINFICGSTFGGPQFVESDTNKLECVFEFNWKTRLACKVESEKMTVTNKGVVKDSQSGMFVDLSGIWNKTYTMDDKSDKSIKYHILLNGSSIQCEDGAICLERKTGQSKFQNLGLYSSAKYYMDDWIMEAQLTTKDKCKGDQSSSNVSSSIQFHCSLTDKDPQLLYVHEDCFYMFVWETTKACITAVILEPASNSSSTGNGPSGGPDSPGSSSKSVGGASTNTIVGIVATFLGAIVLCLLLVVFHKQERRDACFVRVKGLFSSRTSEYSQLPTGTMDDIFGDEEEVVTVQNAAGNESDGNEGNPIITVETTPASYHDDSDEDLLA